MGEVRTLGALKVTSRPQARVGVLLGLGEKTESSFAVQTLPSPRPPPYTREMSLGQEQRERELLKLVGGRVGGWRGACVWRRKLGIALL